MVSEVMANLNIPTPTALNLTTENLAANFEIFHDTWKILEIATGL